MFCIMICLPSISMAQINKKPLQLKEARKNWNNLNFKLSQYHYEKMLEENQEHFDAHLELGILHFEINQNYQEAKIHFDKAYEHMPNDTVYEVYKFIAECNHQMGEYEKAIDFYQKFKRAIFNNDILKTDIENKINQCEFALTKPEKLWDGKFINMGNKVNTEFSEYCSVPLMKDSFLLFTKRNSENLEQKNDIISFENIFFSKQKNKIFVDSDISSSLSEFENISSSDSKYHNAIVSSSITGDSLIIYRKNNLWLSKYESNQWTLPEMFSKTINFGKHQRHGCFSADGKTLYFSSDAKKGNGGFDLYKSSIDSTGNWSVPRNLGAIINTSKDEDSPFITPDGNRLYFASKGHLGYGNFDIFYAEKINDTTWTEPINAGKPINSASDDIFFHILDNDKKIAFLSSSREGGMGQMDIYQFYEYGQSKFENCISFSENITDTLLNEEYAMIKAKDTVFTYEEMTLLADNYCIKDSVTNIFWKKEDSIYNVNNLNFIFDSLSLGNHQFELEILARDKFDEEKRYCVSKSIFVMEEPKIEVPKVRHFKDTNEMALSIGSKLKEGDIIALPDSLNVELSSVYFSFNKSDIRKDQRKAMDENIKLIKANPNIVVKIIGHTDKVGSDEYNIKLSQKRAKSAVKYLTNKGVSLNQIVAVLSNGEDKEGVRYKNEDGTDDVEKMEVSRRVDFYVIGTTK